MAGNDRTPTATPGGPSIILVAPQLGENIGAAARVMFNFGLRDLRLVRPRDGWPNPKAVGMASGADTILDAVWPFDTTAAAVLEIQHLYAATARHRDMVKHVLTPRAAVREMREKQTRGESCAILFGAERAGLNNDDVALCDSIVRVPVNPAFASLNLAQAVAIIAYEWFAAGDQAPAVELALGDARPASRAELIGLFEHLERELDSHNFFRPPERRPSMVRSLRNMILRSRLTDQDARTLRGIIGTLVKGR